MSGQVYVSAVVALFCAGCALYIARNAGRIAVYSRGAKGASVLAMAGVVMVLALVNVAFATSLAVAP